jgi:hypothetical protein
MAIDAGKINEPVGVEENPTIEATPSKRYTLMKYLGKGILRVTRGIGALLTDPETFELFDEVGVASTNDHLPAVGRPRCKGTSPLHNGGTKDNGQYSLI